MDTTVKKKKPRGPTKPIESDESGGYAFAERVTGITRGTLYAMVHARQIPHVRVGPRLVRFTRADLAAWMQEHAVPTADAARRSA